MDDSGTKAHLFEFYNLIFVPKLRDFVTQLTSSTSNWVRRTVCSRHVCAPLSHCSRPQRSTIRPFPDRLQGTEALSPRRVGAIPSRHSAHLPLLTLSRVQVAAAHLRVHASDFSDPTMTPRSAALSTREQLHVSVSIMLCWSGDCALTLCCCRSDGWQLSDEKRR